jgi:hypothetical protein
MMVATRLSLPKSRHGMPGKCHPEARPVLSAIARMATEEGYGTIGWPEGGIVPDGGQSVAPQIKPYPTGRIMSGLYQAFHAWLPSFRPPGTKVSFLRLTQMGGCGTMMFSALRAFTIHFSPPPYAIYRR